MKSLSGVAVLLLMSSASADHHCFSNAIENHQPAGLPELSCCTTRTRENFYTWKHECIFTSECNSLGVCCYKSEQHAGYKALS